VSRRALFRRLAEAERVVQISAPAGSGKTVLMRSWIAEAGLARHAAWVPVDSGERDPQAFWILVADALRDTAAGSALVRPLTAAPDLDNWAVVERLLTDLAPLEDRLWLVIDDADLLGSGEVLRQLELLLLRAPPALRFVLATRHDLRLGQHRLRLEGELTEIRAADLRFSLAEARALFGASGVELPEEALARLHGRTEGWAAGLRLAALSLAGHPDPVRFAAEFSGTDRTVAEYLLAEVLDRQSEEVRRLLLRTSVLERVSGPLADALTGRPGGERILQDLEQAGAFVVALDGRRSWFRYHQLFADLLQLELRRTEPNGRPALHGAAAAWLAGHGHPAEAVRQAQAAEDWGLAARLLSDHWLDLYLSGRGGTLVGLLARFPCRIVAANPELTTVQAAGDLLRRSVADAARHLTQATGALAAVPADRRGRVRVMLTVLRLLLARRVLDFPVVAEEAQRLLAPTEAADAAQLGLGEDLRAAALISLGIAEMWAFRFEDGERHLQWGVRLARAIGRPYLEFTGLTHGTHAMVLFRPDAAQAERSMQAPVLDGSARGAGQVRMVTALLLEARARDALGDQATASLALERALDITESDGKLLPFLLDPAPALLERHRQHRTAHPALISQILDLLPGTTRPAPSPGGQPGWARSRGLDEPLTDSETRVLRYLPTHLTGPEIANELFLSMNTVGTHTRHLYAKLGVHSRHEAVDRARALGLLAPSGRRA
jgi:LuxR family transcriptional regulator, maltose regulon positive regulatory protein